MQISDFAVAESAGQKRATAGENLAWHFTKDVSRLIIPSPTGSSALYLSTGSLL